MTEKTVPSLAESLGQAWRMMKVSWSYPCRPQTDGRHTALTEEGLRILQLKLALEFTSRVPWSLGGNDIEGKEPPSALRWKGPVSLAGAGSGACGRKEGQPQRHRRARLERMNISAPQSCGLKS